MRVASLSEAPEGKAIIGLVGRGEGTVMDPTNYDFGDQHEMLKAATTITMVIQVQDVEGEEGLSMTEVIEGLRTIGVGGEGDAPEGV